MEWNWLRRHPCQLAAYSRDHVYFFGEILTSRVGHRPVFDLLSEFVSKSVRASLQDYKSLCAVVTICVTLVHTHTDTHTDSI